jgi:hypothetical protein
LARGGDVLVLRGDWPDARGGAECTLLELKTQRHQQAGSHHRDLNDGQPMGLGGPDVLAQLLDLQGRDTYRAVIPQSQVDCFVQCQHIGNGILCMPAVIRATHKCDRTQQYQRHRKVVS